MASVRDLLEGQGQGGATDGGALAARPNTSQRRGAAARAGSGIKGVMTWHGDTDTDSSDSSDAGSRQAREAKQSEKRPGVAGRAGAGGGGDDSKHGGDEDSAHGNRGGSAGDVSGSASASGRGSASGSDDDSRPGYERTPGRPLYRDRPAHMSAQDGKHGAESESDVGSAGSGDERRAVPRLRMSPTARGSTGPSPITSSEADAARNAAAALVAATPIVLPDAAPLSARELRSARRARQDELELRVAGGDTDVTDAGAGARSADGGGGVPIALRPGSRGGAGRRRVGHMRMRSREAEDVHELADSLRRQRALQQQQQQQHPPAADDVGLRPTSGANGRRPSRHRLLPGPAGAAAASDPISALDKLDEALGGLLANMKSSDDVRLGHGSGRRGSGSGGSAAGGLLSALDEGHRSRPRLSVSKSVGDALARMGRDDGSGDDSTAAQRRRGGRGGGGGDGGIGSDGAMRVVDAMADALVSDDDALSDRDGGEPVDAGLNSTSNSGVSVSPVDTGAGHARRHVLHGGRPTPLVERIQDGRSTVVRVLAARLAAVRAVRHSWAAQDAVRAVAAVVRAEDDAVTSDFITAVHGAAGMPAWPADPSWVEMICPAAVRLLGSRYEDYVVAGLRCAGMLVAALTPLALAVDGEKPSRGPRPTSAQRRRAASAFGGGELERERPDARDAKQRAEAMELCRELAPFLARVGRALERLLSHGSDIRRPARSHLAGVSRILRAASKSSSS